MDLVVVVKGVKLTGLVVVDNVLDRGSSRLRSMMY